MKITVFLGGNTLVDSRMKELWRTLRIETELRLIEKENLPTTTVTRKEKLEELRALQQKQAELEKSNKEELEKLKKIVTTSTMNIVKAKKDKDTLSLNVIAENRTKISLETEYHNLTLILEELKKQKNDVKDQNTFDITSYRNTTIHINNVKMNCGLIVKEILCTIDKSRITFCGRDEVRCEEEPYN